MWSNLRQRRANDLHYDRDGNINEVEGRAGALSNARTVFERFVSDGESEVTRLVEEKEEENLFLDFKLARSPMTKDDRLSLAEALSGFANSEGGVIVWGVDGRLNPQTGEDVACKLGPIQGLRRFMGDLGRHTAQIVNPGVTGVEHHKVLCEGLDDMGYAVTYVPRSEGGPHMAIGNADQYRYYYRTGSSFRRMEHFMVADRFQRRPQPRLQLAYRVFGERMIPSAPALNGGELLVSLGIRNSGRGLARYPALALFTSDFRALCTTHRGKRPTFERATPHASREDGKEWHLGGAHEVIYPGTELEVLMAVINVGIETPCNDHLVRYELHCEGFSSSGEVVIPGQELTSKRIEAWHA